MAIVNVSLDTATRQTVITINGVIVPSTDFLVEKYTFDGEEFLRFNYTIEGVNNDGMVERVQIYLPSPEELVTKAHSELDEDGLASKTIHDDEKAKADVIEFLKQGRNSQ